MSLSWLLMAAHVPADGRGGGMVRYVVEIARALVARPDVDLHVVADRGAAALWEGILGSPSKVHPMVSVPTAAQGFLERRAMGSVGLRQRFDVVHGAKHILPRRARGATLLTVHDFLPLDRPSDFGVLKRTLLPGPYLSSIQEADALICVSEATQDRLASYVPLALDRSQVVPLAGNAMAGIEPRAVPELVDQDFALVVGDSSARKNLTMLLKLWPEVVAQVPYARLAVVGPPSWKNRDGVSGSQGVQHLGYLPESALAWCYRNARVVLCPSLLEGFGLPAREALELGAQVITSEDPALCEVGASAQHLYGASPSSWVEPIVGALRHTGVSRPGAPQVRTWADVAADTEEVMLRVLDP